MAHVKTRPRKDTEDREVLDNTVAERTPNTHGLVVKRSISPAQNQERRMRSNIGITIILVIIHTISFRNFANAQQNDEKCQQIRYSSPRKGAKPYRLEHIEGQTVLAPVSQNDEAWTSGICLVLFNEKDKKPIAVTTSANDTGRFELRDVAPGAYTLIASVEGEELHKIVLPIRLYATKEKGSRLRGILLHLRLKEDSRNSYSTLITNLALREELLLMVERDQSVRNELIRKGVDHPDQAIQEKMRSIDTDNLARLKVILQKYGWPGPGLVGRDGADAAFLIVQHADHAFQKKALPLVRKEYLAGRLSGNNYALLLDRVLVEEGKPQIYGTRMKPVEYWNGKEPVFFPIKDEVNVDKRRAKLHMQPWSEYRELMKKMYFPQTQNK